MYKVFINQKPVVFASIDQFDTQFINNRCVLFLAKNQIPKSIFNKILDPKQQIAFVICKNLKSTFSSFKKQFKLVKAGGGLVFNPQNNLLFIYRKGFWDLPKGKLDRGETIKNCAIREVKEECGLKQLQCKNLLTHTYHVYSEKGKIILKETTWFLMHVNKKQKLVPQTDEGIQKIDFFSKKQFTTKLSKKTYPLIKDLILSLPQNQF